MNLKITLRDITLGGQDGLVNVLGLSLGLFAANSGGHIIIVAGLAAGLSEAISMGAVAYTSALAESNPQGKEKERLIISSIVVGVAALVGALIPVLPFLLFKNPAASISLAIIFSAIILYILGSYRGAAVKVNKFKSGIGMVVIGLICAFAGFLIGLALKTPSL